MDPVGPWSAYASYNRLAAAGVQAGAASGDFHHHLSSGGAGQAGVPSTTSQLLLQAAHATGSIAGTSASHFNPAGFLSPTPVSYDAVFSPLFHQKAPAHYAAVTQQHRQALAQAQAQAQAAAASIKQSSESDGQSSRENYSGHPQGQPFFEQGATPPGAAAATPLAWQQNSPFGILPHESVVPNSPGAATTKSSTVYENFNAHFAAAQSLNHLNSQLAAASSTKTSRAQSPQVQSAKPPSSQANSTSFFQVPTSNNQQNQQQTQQNQSQTQQSQQNQSQNQQEYTSSGSSANNKTFQSSGNSNASSVHQSQQSCIVSSPSNTPASKEYRIPQAPARSIYLNPPAIPITRADKTPVRSTTAVNFVAPQSKPAQQSTPQTQQQQIQTKAQTKIYPELSNQSERQRNSEGEPQSQSSPISYSIMDAPGRLHYSGSNSSAKSGRNSVTQFQHSINQQGGNFRHYQSGNNQSDSDYHRSKNSGEYSSNNGPDCGVVVPRRPSPLQAHSQASPLGHVASPAYPMYNSPMNSISSPQQQNSNNQVAPPSPLDVSVPRPSSQASNVAYSSVITRALGNDNKNYNENRYERSNQNNQQQQQQNQQSNCWEERRKFPAQNSSNYNSGNSIEIPSRQIEIATRVDIQTQPAQQSNQTRALGITDRQQAYFDNSSNQVTLQDLSSCRGDPMTIVKNLQNLQSNPQQAQQSCQIQEQKPEVKTNQQNTNNKRRKSNEKPANAGINELAGSTISEYFTGRIPPPAHSSAANQQQQNGAYFDFERWNLPPPPPKMFAGNPAFATQGIHHAAQHQPTLMVPHPHSHHPPPPIPYFPAFHLPPHHEFPSSVELTPLSGYNDNNQSSHNQPNQYQTQQTPEENSKVVVPNIEEELSFLQEGGRTNTTTVNQQQPHQMNLPQQSQQIPLQPKPPEKKGGPGAGFMNSYLRFLQGERDTSPPPISRGTRKSTWQRQTKPFDQQNQISQNQVNQQGSQLGQNQPTQIQQTPQVVNKYPETNGITPMSHHHPHVPPSPLPQKDVKVNPPTNTRLTTQGDPQDDPRYFPLPKERKSGSLESSSDGFSSEEDFLPPVKSVKESLPKEKGSRKGRPIKPGGPTERRKMKQEMKNAASTTKTKQPDPKPSEEELPRREQSKRAAKEKINMKQLIEKTGGEEELEEPAEFVDSDSDPAWTPQLKEDGEEELVPVLSIGKKRVKKMKPGSARKRASGSSRNLISAAAHGAGINEIDGYSSGEVMQSKKQKASAKHGSNKQGAPPTLEDNIAASMKNNTSTHQSDDIPFKSGEFVVIKSELKEEWPAIWRVDGKTLLQKYEPFEQNGTTLYRNISTYTSWTAENKKQYVSVPVKFKSQNQMETIVEFLRTEMVIVDSDYIEKAMKEAEVYQDNFEVYIQTLISQALDSNFLTEIFQEQDDYFLSNVKIVDDITEDRKSKLLRITNWPERLKASVSTWPCFNVITELLSSDTDGKLCAACQRPNVSLRVLMYGQPYNATTLEGCPPNPQAILEKDFVMCRLCSTRVELYNKVAHQKYLMYIECAKRVGEKRSADPHKDTTVILNELLADETWLSQLFQEVRYSWAEIDSLEHHFRPSQTKS